MTSAVATPPGEFHWTAQLHPYQLVSDASDQTFPTSLLAKPLRLPGRGKREGEVKSGECEAVAAKATSDAGARRLPRCGLEDVICPRAYPSSLNYALYPLSSVFLASPVLFPFALYFPD